MSLTVIQNSTACAPGISVYFGGSGGTAPYAYSVLPGGAGGTIDAVTGLYTAPAGIPTTPLTSIDTIQVTDSTAPTPLTATATILIATPLELVCDIIQNQMGLARGRVYLWDQKINQPIDNDLYVAVSMLTCKPFGNNFNFDGSGPGLDNIQSINMQATVQIDIISRGPAARDQKELVLLALQSVYSEQQQEANSFYISRLSTSFVNLSNIDGAAIPYRYSISMALQYFVTNNVSVPYFSDFSNSTVTVNP